MPEAIFQDFPGMLDLPLPRLFTYPNESVISEKYQAIVNLGMANSRLKDFFDIWYLIEHFNFDGITVCEAIKATFDTRETPIPKDTPLGLSDEFCHDEQKKKQWNAFLNRTGLDADDLSFAQLVQHIREFLKSPTEHLERGKRFNRKWKPGGPWLV